MYQKFIAETDSELWDSEEELIAHYNEEKNYLRLKSGQVGGNLIYKYMNIRALFRILYVIFSTGEKFESTGIICTDSFSILCRSAGT